MRNLRNKFIKFAAAGAALSMLTAVTAFAEDNLLIAPPDAEQTGVNEEYSLTPAEPITVAFAKTEETGDAVMVPVRKVAENFGYTVEWDGKEQSVALSRGAQYLKLWLGRDEYAISKSMPQSLGAASILLNDETTYVPVNMFTDLLGFFSHEDEAYVTVVEPRTAELTEILEDGALSVKDSYIGDVVVYIDEDTVVTADREAVSKELLKDLKAGQLLDIEYSEAMTMSLPPQTTAVRIDILNLPYIAEPEGDDKDENENKNENENENEKIEAVAAKLLSFEEDGALLVSEDRYGEVIVRITEDTKITKNGEKAEASDLKEGQELEIVYDAAMTRSIPPQTNAVSIEIK